MQTDAARSIVTSGKPWEQKVGFSQCIRFEGGPLLFLSGQVSLDADGQLVGRDDLRLQARTAFNNIRDLLHAGGSSMESIIKLTYFVTDMSQWSIVQEVRAEFFPTYFPASTTVEVSRLHRPEYLIEIEAIALAGPPG